MTRDQGNLLALTIVTGATVGGAFAVWTSNYWLITLGVAVSFVIEAVSLRRQKLKRVRTSVVCDHSHCTIVERGTA